MLYIIVIFYILVVLVNNKDIVNLIFIKGSNLSK